MKATGIVRKIDEVGRIVLPMEIRNMLNLDAGVPMEIYTDKMGQIVFKKYSPFSNLLEHLFDCGATLHNTFGYSVCICDNSHILMGFGPEAEHLKEEKINSGLWDLILTGETVLQDAEGGNNITSLCKDKENNPMICWQMITPVISQKAVMGSIIMFSCDSSKKPENSEQVCMEFAARLLSRHMKTDRFNV